MPGKQVGVILRNRHQDDKPYTVFWGQLSENHYILCKHLSQSVMERGLPGSRNARSRHLYGVPRGYYVGFHSFQGILLLDAPEITSPTSKD